MLVITPFAYVPSDKYLINDHSFGPSEFIQAINNASLVITDSYHGTLFSLNLGTPFLSISSGSGSSTRKDQVLSRLHLSDHIVGSLKIQYQNCLKVIFLKIEIIGNCLIN